MPAMIIRADTGDYRAAALASFIFSWRTLSLWPPAEGDTNCVREEKT
jgi:hypothetical protein